MSEKVIGIKLADGSFYPVMKEGTPVNKTLELTTVRDGQTTVQLNLFRSETGTMEGAEYVDSLMIENLIPHPKLEPSFNLNLNLDENNVLSATIDDPETGITSNSTVSLVTLSEENQNIDDDFSISNSADSEEFETVNDLTNTPSIIEDDENTISSLPDFQDDDIIQPEEEIELSVPTEDDSDLATALGVAGLGVAAATAFADDDFSFVDDTSADSTPADDDFSFADDTLADSTPADDDFSFADDTLADSTPTDDDFSFADDTLADSTQTDDDFSFADDTLADSTPTDDDFSFADDTLADSTPADDDFSFTDDTLADSTPADDDFSFADDTLADSTPADDDFSFADDTLADSTPTDDDFSFADDTLADSTQTDDDFSFTSESLPDFSGITEEENNSLFGEEDDDKPFSFSSLPEFDEIPEIADNPDDDTFFDLPDFDEIPELADNPNFDNTDFELPDLDSSTESLTQPNTAFSDLDDLYEETIRENERGQKRFVIPVAICVLCSIICLGVLIYMIFFAPKLNSQKQAEEQAIIQEILPQDESQNLVEDNKTDPNAAKYDQVVVTTEVVVPEPILPKEEKSAEITHKVRWGDTLWDLSNTYYKTPWLYKKIAKANKIINPDLIISGTTIVIPPKQ